MKPIPIKKFNRLCLIICALWLVVTVPLGLLWRPTMPDFGQFYMGGLLARTGQWQLLYPMPVPGAQDNAGMNGHSVAKSGWSDLAEQHKVGDYTHFILPPVSALAFIPFSLGDYYHGYVAWIAFLTLCAYGVAVVSSRLLRKALGKPTRYEGALALAVVLSPVTARAIRVANVTPVLAFCIGLVLLLLLNERKGVSVAAAIVVGSVLKYVTLVIVPLLLILRRQRAILATVLVGGVVFVASIVVAGVDVHAEFIQKIAPTLSRASAYPGNQSLPGLLARLFGRPLPHAIAAMLSILRLGTLALLFVALARPGAHVWRRAVNLLAAAAALLTWLLMFSPIAWEHWPIMLCPVWGWIWYEALQGPRAIKTTALVAFLLMYFPAGIIQVYGIAAYPLVLPEPLNSSQLAGMVLTLVLAIRRTTGLVKTRVGAATERNTPLPKALSRSL